MKFLLRISSVNVNKCAPADLVIFTEEILNAKLNFLSSELMHENRTIRTLFSLAFGSSHFGRSSAASINRKLPSLSETLKKESKIAAVAF